ncbi:MAG: TonB-dependent receptor [Acidobacteria bacterium]|nr:TonB-dependent receptor [Acidobacteriota bacterium]
MFIFLSCRSVCAQDLDEASITGRVADENGAVIPRASVTVFITNTKLERRAVTDAAGTYRLIELPPGAYLVRVSAEGFATAERENLAAVAGQQLRLNFVLRPATVNAAQSVSAEAEPPPVDTARTIVGGTITGEEAESLPNATRSPLDLIYTLPGVTEEPLSTRELAEDRDSNPRSTPEEAGTFSLNGSPAYSNNLTIDGLDNNDDRAARERFQPSLEAVAEVQVITNQFSAEYGRASGGRINLRTRGGSGKLHGRAFFFLRNDIFDANSFNNNARGLKRLPLTELNPGFTLSGPLKVKQSWKSFFFVSYENTRLLDTARIDTLVPVEPSSLFRLPAPTALDARRIESASSPSLNALVAPFIMDVSTPLINHIFTARVDHRLSDAHNGTALFQLGRLDNLRGFGGGNRLAEALQGKSRNSDAISYTDNYILSARLINQARVQFSRLTPALTAAGKTGPVVLISLNDSLSESDPNFRTGTLVAGSSTAGASDRLETRWQAQDTLTLLRGAHTIRVGADVQRIRSTFIDLADVSGTFNFGSAGDFLAGVPERFRQNFMAESTQRNFYASLFVQHEWRLGANLLLTFGLRYENETIIRDRNNVAPRFAVAYDPFGNGKTVIRVGAGIFYSRALLRTVDDFTLGGQQLFFDTNDLRNPITGRLLTAAERRAFIAANIHFPSTFNTSSPLIEQYAVRNAAFLRRLDPALRIPESYQANLGFERELGRGFVLEANYSWNRGIHLWREFNANAPVLPTGYRDLTEYLLARDFPNFRHGPGGIRPLYDVTSAGELVRFTLAPFDPTNPARCPSPFTPSNPDVVGCIVEFGIPITLINLNSFTSSTSVDVALAALRDLRPDPTRGEVEQLASIGNSFYHGLTLELRRRFSSKKSGFSLSFRAAYTLSHLIDDGIVNTSDALTPADFRRERARSLIDRRHRFVFSGTFDLPRTLGRLRVSPILRLASGAPFNISINGADRNLDDVSNDRPIFTGDIRRLLARHPGDPIDASLLNYFSLPTIGRTGNLPRNAGSGPGLFLFDLNLTREFRIGERVRVRPTIEIDNVLNKAVWSFGSEFINFKALSPAATPSERQALLDSFLLTTRTLRPRMMRFGIRFDF